MFPRLGVWAGFLLFPFLCLWGITEGAPAVERTLTSSTAAALRGDPFSHITVAADGRTILLRGQVATEADKAQAQRVASAVRGVHGVKIEIEIQSGVSEVQALINRILTQRIDFEPGQADIAQSSLPVLGALRNVLNSAPAFAVQVDGYTDNSGVEEKNRAISQLRAQAVVNWLAAHGVARGRMQAAGHGPDRPIASNDSPEGRVRNRRVEITVSER